MPTVALHSNYWATQGPAPQDPIGASGAGGYTPWQTTVIGNPSGFGISVSMILWVVVLPAATRFGG